tara:strand:- start:31102 stop:32196 length:1095 start_codon:yes stop_codon:yes gene_type:complete
MNGFIKIHRSFIYWEWYKNNNTRFVFLHLLITANFAPKRWQGITIERGQLVTSKAKLAHELGLSMQQIKTVFSNLRTTGEITTKATNKYTIVTICNYASYQNIENENNQQNNQQTTNKPTNEQPQLKNIKNKEKNNKKEKRKILVDELPPEIGPIDARQNTALPFDIVTANKTLKNLDRAEIMQTYKNIFGAEVNADQYDRALNTFCTVGVATYQKYKGIRTVEKLKNLFTHWINKNINYQSNRPKYQAPAPTAEDLKNYFKENYSKRWNQTNEAEIKESCKNFTEWLPRFTELKNECKNENLTEIVLFFVTFRNLGDAVTPSAKPIRRFNGFKRWFSKLSDYNQRKGNIKKLLEVERDRQKLL